MKKILITLLIVMALFTGCDFDELIEEEENKDSEYANINVEELKITDALYVEKNIELNNYDVHIFPWKDIIMENVTDLLNKFNNDSKCHYIEEDINLLNLFSKRPYKKTIDQTDLIYVGDLKKNRPDGTGVLIKIIDGINYIMYAGEFKKGFYSGYGQEYNIPEYVEQDLDYANVDRYVDYTIKDMNYLMFEGNYEKGKKSGNGNEYYYNLIGKELINYSDESGDFTVDETYYDLRNNFKLVNVTAAKYENGKMNGKAKIYILGYLSYEGNMKNDYYDGKGKLYYVNSDQIKYKGEFCKDEYDGKGTVYDENGNKEYSGEWVMGEIK